MDINLFSQTLLLVLSVATSSIVTYIVIEVFRVRKRIKGKIPKKQLLEIKQNIKKFVLGFIASCLVDIIIIILAENTFGSKLPFSLFFMILPFTICSSLLVIIILVKRELWKIASICAILSLILSLVMINGYYGFYSTVGEIFKISSGVTKLDSPSKATFGTTSKHSIEAGIDISENHSKDGQVYSLNIPGVKSGFKARTAYVYVPSAYSVLDTTNFPVMVLTAGFPGVTENWLGSGLKNTVDQFALQHDGVTPLIFMVDNTGSLTNDTECVNSPRGNVETYLTSDVPTYIKSHFRVVNSPSNWAIGGLSMGGMCGLMLTLRHTNTYHYFLDYGGESGPEVGPPQATVDALFNGSIKAYQQHQPNLLLETNKYKGMGIGGFYGYGIQDESNVTQAINKLVKQSKAAGIETQTDEINGSHTFQTWQQLFKDSLPWISSKLDATS
jgi:S-formylglutathione hydrolase FrmB